MKREPFRTRFLLAWQAYERLVGSKVDGQAFATALGVSRPLVSAWQEADEPPPHARIRQIAQLTGIDPGWLAYGEDCAALVVPALDGDRKPAAKRPTLPMTKVEAKKPSSDRKKA